mgnify:CR=1 FL=1
MTSEGPSRHSGGFKHVFVFYPKLGLVQMAQVRILNSASVAVRILDSALSAGEFKYCVDKQGW